jgi:hypothetical protein
MVKQKYSMERCRRQLLQICNNCLYYIESSLEKNWKFKQLPNAMVQMGFKNMGAYIRKMSIDPSYSISLKL